MCFADAGLSFSAVMQDPAKLLEALPVLMNFDLHFDVMTSVYIQPAVIVMFDKTFKYISVYIYICIYRRFPTRMVYLKHDI